MYYMTLHDISDFSNISQMKFYVDSVFYLHVVMAIYFMHSKVGDCKKSFFFNRIALWEVHSVVVSDICGLEEFFIWLLTSQ